MPCTHDLGEQEGLCADGVCPICLSIRVKDLEKVLRNVLALTGKSQDFWNDDHQDLHEAHTVLERKVG